LKRRNNIRSNKWNREGNTKHPERTDAFVVDSSGCEGAGALWGFNLLVPSLYRKASFDSGLEGLWNRKEKFYLFLTAAVSSELLFGVTLNDVTAGRRPFVRKEHW